MSEYSDEDESRVAGEEADAAADDNDLYQRRRRRFVFVAWFVCGTIFLASVYGLAGALWGTRPTRLFASPFTSSYPGDTYRVMRTWEQSRSGNFTEALEESEGIVLDPNASKEERETSEVDVAYNAWQLGETQVASDALADFSEHSRGLDLDPGILREGRRMNYLIEHHIPAKDVNRISRADWTRASKTLENPSFTSNLKGWYIGSGSGGDKYTIGVDPQGYPPNQSSAYLTSNNAGEQDWNTLMQEIAAEKYLRKRVELTTQMKTDDAATAAYLWLRVDTPSVSYLAHVPDPPITGTTAWQQESIVQDVPDDAQGIAVGEVLVGSGKASLANVRLDVVGNDVPTTPAESRF